MDEVIWQHGVGTLPITSRRFTSEAAWVVLCAGMSESVVRRVFPQISTAFSGFDPIVLGQRNGQARADALAIFAHERKIDAILEIAATARTLGTSGLRRALLEPEAFLRSLPYIGPVTWRHLAKNLGTDVAKADRHLTRLAQAAGRRSVDALCGEISGWLGEPTAVVDVVLWRWSVLRAAQCGSGHDYLSGWWEGSSPVDSFTSHVCPMERERRDGESIPAPVGLFDVT
jgi:hypothetical protein